jgi:hypothetical protein
MALMLSVKSVAQGKWEHPAKFGGLDKNGLEALRFDA